VYETLCSRPQAALTWRPTSPPGFGQGGAWPGLSVFLGADVRVSGYPRSSLVGGRVLANIDNVPTRLAALAHLPSSPDEDLGSALRGALLMLP